MVSIQLTPKLMCAICSTAVPLKYLYRAKSCPKGPFYKATHTLALLQAQAHCAQFLTQTSVVVVVVVVE